VVADAKVLPLADVSLAFERSGTVAEVLVREGDTVAAGQPLARLDSAALELQVAQARVGLKRAQARYEQIAAGAPPEALAVAQAAIDQARASQAQAAAAISPQDIAAAQAQLSEARATLTQLTGGPKRTEVAQAQAALDQANANLQSQRNSLSAAKTNAQIALEQASIGLQQAQSSYSVARWNWQYVEETGVDPVTPSVTDPSGKSRNNTLTDTQRQRYYDAYVQAGLAVQSAEQAVQKAQVAYDNARQAEVDGIAGAEARARDAQAKLAQLMAPADADKIAAAQARIAAAQARLAQLRGPARSTSLAAAAAGVTQAEAAHNQVAAPVRAVDLEVARTDIDAAQVALDQAELELRKATLRAPFAGTVAQMQLDPGAVTGPSSPAVVLADFAKWRIETEDLTELDVVKLRKDQRVTVRFDALPGVALPGRIVQIKSIGGNRQGDIVYTVVVELEQSDARLHWNMTAVVSADAAP
jgi:HlyD family secretion protein